MMNRRTFALAGLVAVPVRLRTPSGANARKHRKPKRKVVTRSFANPRLIEIPFEGPAYTYPSVITVGRLPRGVIQKVTVTLNRFDHNEVEHLNLMIVAPDGHGVILLSGVEGSWIMDKTLTFDDAAPTKVPSPFVSSGVFKPTNLDTDPVSFPFPAPGGVAGSALAEFKGSNPNGKWKLFVFDDTARRGGDIYGWSLTIRARIKVQPKRKRKRKQRPKAENSRQVNGRWR